MCLDMTTDGVETHLDERGRNHPLVFPSSLEEDFEIHIEELEDEVKFLVRVYDFQKSSGVVDKPKRCSAASKLVYSPDDVVII